MTEWHEFWLLGGTAAATLMGLVFVALSVNKEAIAQQQHHRSIARQTLLCLSAVLALSMLGLIPDQGMVAFGSEITVATLLNLVPSAVIQVRTLLAMHRNEPGHEASDRDDWRDYLIKALIFDSMLITCIVTGVLLALHHEGALFALVPATFGLSGLAVVNAWSLVMHVNDPAEENDEGEDENSENGKKHPEEN